MFCLTSVRWASTGMSSNARDLEDGASGFVTVEAAKGFPEQKPWLFLGMSLFFHVIWANPSSLFFPFLILSDYSIFLSRCWPSHFTFSYRFFLSQKKSYLWQFQDVLLTDLAISRLFPPLVGEIYWKAQKSLFSIFHSLRMGAGHPGPLGAGRFFCFCFQPENVKKKRQFSFFLCRVWLKLEMSFLSFFFVCFFLRVFDFGLCFFPFFVCFQDRHNLSLCVLFSQRANAIRDKVGAAARFLFGLRTVQPQFCRWRVPVNSKIVNDSEGVFTCFYSTFLGGLTQSWQTIFAESSESESESPDINCPKSAVVGCRSLGFAFKAVLPSWRNVMPDTTRASPTAQWELAANPHGKCWFL